MALTLKTFLLSRSITIPTFIKSCRSAQYIAGLISVGMPLSYNMSIINFSYPIVLINRTYDERKCQQVSTLRVAA